MMLETSEATHSAEKDAWVGCVHCGQTLPHEGTSWREAYRCRLFQRIAEQAWDEGWAAGGGPPGANPYRVTPPGEVASDAR